MTPPPPLPPIAGAGVRHAQVLVACNPLEPTLAFLQSELGFQVDAIFPADSPRVAMVSAHGVTLRLQQGASGGATDLYLLCDTPPAHGAGPMTAPNGLRIHLVAADPPMRQPATQQQLVLTRSSDDDWGVGRAGMRYRDTLPGRLGGAFIASHIRILEGGPVGDYVHFHKIRFQMIFCRKGWVRVAYEGQGEPLVMRAGDCVLQPPRIRHRVLESSAGAEVVEICTPAEHLTVGDRNRELPGPNLPPGHRWDGQRFVFHQAEQAPWSAWRVAGFEAQDTGIGSATDGLAGVRVVRATGAAPPRTQAHASEFCYYFVLEGRIEIEIQGQTHQLAAEDSIAIPDALPYTLNAPSADLRLLEVTLPAELSV